MPSKWTTQRRRNRMKVAFVVRNYPPDIGGAEKFNFELAKNLSNVVDLMVIQNKFDKYSPLFHIYAFIKILMVKVDLIFLSDSYLSPLIPFLKFFKGRPVVVKVHGLDITYPNILYQWIIPRLTNMADKVICISIATKEECVQRGIDSRKSVIIPVGISDEFYSEKDKNELQMIIFEKMNLNSKKIIFSVGRLVERKGFHWFVETIIPKLIEREKNFVYLIAGGGPYRGVIEEIVNKKHLEEYVKLLGKIDDETLKSLYNAADIFVMPNIPVKGDLEGFGIVILEASSCGVPVVASNIEGIRDAAMNGKNGFLVESYDVDGFTDVIIKLLENDYERKRVGMNAREFTLENFRWEKIAKSYFEIFKLLLKSI